MRVLQLGTNNWEEQYKIDKDLEWQFNNFNATDNSSDKTSQNYDVVIVTEKVNLTSKDWEKLKTVVLPYHVLYKAELLEQLDKAEKDFLKSLSAKKIVEDPQTLINKLKGRFFSGQSGMRIFPTELMLNSQFISEFEYPDAAHLKLKLNTENDWVNIGTYKPGIFIDPNKLINFWLSVKKNNFDVRMRVFVRDFSADGDVKNQRIIDLKSYGKDDYFSQIEMSKKYRSVAISLEVKGSGEIVIGPLHSRWGRDGFGTFMNGGKRIINPINRDDIAYLFNKGDLKPPLNVYFSGAREKEGFEAFYLFRRLKKPSLLFTDMRLSVGSFYVDKDKFMEHEIIKTIRQKMKELCFDNSQVIVNGISMGTYPAIKYGAKLRPYAINVAKPIINLGYVASRAALERPDDFDTIFDIDSTLISDLTKSNLKKLDQQFWKEFNQFDLSKTRLFLGYMEDDDYDDQAINRLKESNAVKNSLQFTIKGFPGRHNDDPRVVSWFMSRLSELLKEFK